MSADPEPRELARLVAFAERPRVGDWSLRSSLVRYAQGQPQRVSDLLEVVRRVEAALHAHDKDIRRGGRQLWTAIEDDSAASGPEPLVALLREVARLDTLADALATWADDRHGPRPDADVDTVTAEVSERLDDLGIGPPTSAIDPPR